MAGLSQRGLRQVDSALGRNKQAPVSRLAMIRRMRELESDGSGRQVDDLAGRQRDGLTEGSGNPLASAYEQRTKQLHETRSALAEAVSALTMELKQQRDEREQALVDREQAVIENRGLRKQAEALDTEVQNLRHRLAALEGELQAAHELTVTVRNMKVMRWTTWPRRLVDRLRARRG
jgi:hypothetical protein